MNVKVMFPLKGFFAKVACVNRVLMLLHSMQCHVSHKCLTGCKTNLAEISVLCVRFRVLLCHVNIQISVSICPIFTKVALEIFLNHVLGQDVNSERIIFIEWLLTKAASLVSFESVFIIHMSP